MEYIVQYIVSFLAFFIAYFGLTLAVNIVTGKISIGKSKKEEQKTVKKSKGKAKKSKDTNDLYSIFKNSLIVSFIFIIGIIIYKMIF